MIAGSGLSLELLAAVRCKLQAGLEQGCHVDAI